MLRRVSVEVELHRGVLRELDGADAHPLRTEVHLLDDLGQQLPHVWKTLDARAVRRVDDEDDVRETCAG